MIGHFVTIYLVALEATGLYLMVELFSFNVPKCISETLDVYNEPRSNKASNGKPRDALCALQREQKLKKDSYQSRHNLSVK